MNLPKLEKRGYLQDLESVFFDSDSNSKSLFDLKILNYEGKDTNPCEVKNRKVELKS